MSNNTSQHPKSDIIVDDAIVQATSNLEIEDKNQDNQLEYLITESELEKMQALSKALRTSVNQLPGWAISYANFVKKKINEADPNQPEVEAQKIWQKWKDDQIKHYQNELNAQKDMMKNSQKKHRYQRLLILTQELADKLEELGMENAPGECIFLGVVLMHEKLIVNTTLPVNNPIQV
jgi:hypothetical protein